MADKIAACAAVLAKEHPGAQDRADDLSRARVEFRWNDQCAAQSGIQEKAKEFRDGGPQLCAPVRPPEVS